MSQLLQKPTAIPGRRQPSNRPPVAPGQPRVRHLPRPELVVHTTYTETVVPARGGASTWLAMAGALAVGLATYVGSSLGGQVLLERARQESISARGRAKLAKRAETVLRNQIEGLTQSMRIDAWASANGFVLAPPAAEEAISGSGD